MSTNSVYRSVDNFKTTQTSYESCRNRVLTEKALDGVHFCLSVKRPEAQIKESLNYLFVDDFEQLMGVAQENDEESIQSIQRPSLLLAGPYHYEVRFVF